MAFCTAVAIASFQSTPSVGRATALCSAIVRFRVISIHALRGEGDASRHFRYLSIHIFQSTPSVGRATFLTASVGLSYPFQSTPSVGRATDDHDVKLEHVTISIHALRGEGDVHVSRYIRSC